MAGPRPRLLFLITEDWYFWTHRLDLARAARDAGYEVCIATKVRELGARIEAEGFRLFPISLSRRSKQPFRELAAISELIRLYERERPDIVHHVAMKPILYGTVAARLARIPVVVNAFAGLGYGFEEGGQGGVFIRGILKTLLRCVLGSGAGVALFQNDEDCETLVRARIADRHRTHVIRGAGVNLEVFLPRPEPPGEPIVLLASRMLWAKGISEFVEAAMRLRREGVRARFVLAGRPDVDNPGAVPMEKLQAWADSGVVEWWGHCDDMPKVLSQAAVVVLPTFYREGLPKVLLEAGACGRPVIATNIPGCRDVVRPPSNGLLVPSRNADALAAAIRTLVGDSSLREQMGRQGREIVEKEFSVGIIAGKTLELYRQLLLHGQGRKN